MMKRKLESIRNRDKKLWDKATQQLLKGEETVITHQLSTVFDDHWRWHLGEFSEVDELYMVEQNNELVITLAKFYKARAYNTGAKLQASRSLFKSLMRVDNNIQNEVERLTGESLLCSIHSWNVWNITEQLDFREIHKSIKFLEQIRKGNKAHGKYNAKKKDILQLCLALGVMFLRINNYSNAKYYLWLAESKLSEQSVWASRVASAQALLYSQLDRFDKAKFFLERATDGIREHFGPLGWQLRIAETLFNLGVRDKAIDLVKTIYQETTQKKENIYSFWALIYYRKYTEQNFFLDEFNALSSKPEYCEMKRARRYCITNNLVKYENRINSGS